jgi:hypothetical protein
VDGTTRATGGKGASASGLPWQAETPRRNESFAILIDRLTEQIEAESALNSKGLDLDLVHEASRGAYFRRHGVAFDTDVERFADAVEDAAFDWLQEASTSNLQTLASLQSSLLAEKTIGRLHAGAERFVAETRDRILPEYETPPGPAHVERFPREIPGRRAHNAAVEFEVLAKINEVYLKILYLHPDGRGAIFRLAESAGEGALAIESLLVKAYDANRKFFSDVAEQHLNRGRKRERSHVWRYPPIVMGGLRELGLEGNGALVAFALHSIAPLRAGEYWKRAFLVAGIALAAAAVVATGPLGLLVAAVDLGLAGLELYRNFFGEMENLLAANAGAFPVTLQLTERPTDFGSTALLGAAVLVSAFALAFGGLKAYKAWASGRQGRVPAGPPIDVGSSRGTGAPETGTGRRGFSAPPSTPRSRLQQQQRAGALREAADTLQAEVTGLRSEADLLDQRARAERVRNQSRADRIQRRADQHRRVASALEDEVADLRRQADEFESGRRSAIEDLPGPEDVDALLAQAQPETGTGVIAVPLSRVERNPDLLERLVRPLLRSRTGNRVVFRVESERSRQLITVGLDGSVRIAQGVTHHLNFGSWDRALEFVRRSARGRTRVVIFEVDEEWVRSLRTAAIPEYRTRVLGGRQPRLVDVRFADDQMEIPPSLTGELQQFVVPGSGQVLEIF